MLKQAGIALAGIFAAASASVAHAEPDQVWTGFFLNGKPFAQSNFLFWFDGHARLRESGEERDVSIIRPGIGWRVNDKLDLYVGYASVTQHRDTGGDIHEERTWQQANFPIAKFGGGALTGRTRLEQRCRDNGDTGWRLRQFIRYGRPFEGTPFGAVVSDEIFVNLNDTNWGQRDGFDQNRLFVGGYWQAHAKLRVELGYLSQHINAPKDVNRDNLGLQVFATF